MDAVVVGAGLNGIYQIYRLVQQGLNIRAFEAGDGVGGVWFWNRYPGARCDSHFPFYQYWFSKELWDEADWKERYPGQVEIEAYFNHVCDKFDLKRHITFRTRVTAAEVGHLKLFQRTLNYAVKMRNDRITDQDLT